MNFPDARGWIIIGLFSLTFFIFAIMALNPAIAGVQLFGNLSMVVVSGGLGGAAGYYFGSSKESSAKDATISTQAVTVAKQVDSNAKP